MHLFPNWEKNTPPFFAATFNSRDTSNLQIETTSTKKHLLVLHITVPILVAKECQKRTLVAHTICVWNFSEPCNKIPVYRVLFLCSMIFTYHCMDIIFVWGNIHGMFSLKENTKTFKCSTKISSFALSTSKNLIHNRTGWPFCFGGFSGHKTCANKTP